VPCLVGIAAIPAVFGLARTLFNRRVAVLASGFVACSSWHLFWAQNARYPVFTFFFAVLMAWCFYLSFERESVLLMIGALFTCVCLTLSHPLSVVIVPALATYAIICLLEKSTRKRWLNLLIFFLPFVLPALLVLILPEVRGYLFSGWGRNEWQRSALYIVLTLVQGVSVPVMVTAFFGAIATRFDRPMCFLICYAGVPLLLFLVASQFQNVAGYYLFWTTGAYFILAGVACEQLWKIGIGRSLGLLVPCILLVTLLSQTYLYFNIENGGRPKWREVFAAIDADKRPGDKVVLSEPEMGKYYLPALTSIYIGELLNGTGEFERQWKSSGRDRLWFVIDVASFNVFDENSTVRNWIRRRGHIVETFPAFSRAKDRTIHLYLLE